MNQKISACSEEALLLDHASSGKPAAIRHEIPGIVDSLLHPLAILIRQVLTRSGRADLNLILIDDEENIDQALDAGVELHSVYYSGESISRELLRRLPIRVRVHEVARRTCKKLFENDRVARVFAIAHAPALPGLDSLLETARDIVALEDLTIAGNIGAIVRSALAFGVGGVILLNAEPVDIYDRRIIRASRGHIFSLPVLTVTTEEFLLCCRDHNLPILVMAAQADRLAHEVASLSGPLAIVFGSEKDGCSQTVRAAATLRVQIPTDSRVESLNVSTAAGIMLYQRAWFNIHQLRK